MSTFTLPEPPSANRWWRNVSGRMVISREAREYKQGVELTLMAGRAPTIPVGSPVRIAIDWYRGRKSGDLDKRIGVLLDALQGTAYVNDAQVVDIHARRFDDKANPRVVVTVEVAPQ